ncbi:MAG TPA: family 65 glycosyl hydrolase, partial [Feifaniaceae bacterium]|nr:family 65 glycosyl hydrolase [Feifaniaceae bacterium]
MAKIADRHFTVHPWEVREQGFDPAYAQAAESVFSLGNEYMGVRGYFEEGYSGKSLQGSYINGVYERRMLPKSGYRGMLPHTEFMVNTVDFLYTRIRCNGVLMDLAACKVSDFERVLDLKTGVLTRRLIWQVDEATALQIGFERFLSMERPDTAGQRVSFCALSGSAVLEIAAGLDFSRPHAASGENFWEITEKTQGVICSVTGETVNTRQRVHAAAAFSGMACGGEAEAGEKTAAARFAATLSAGETCALTRVARVLCAKTEEQKERFPALCREAGERIASLSYSELKGEHAAWWERQWAVSDITIEGDDENQQGVRYCIYQLHQTLHTADHSSIIGAKGLTGESYNGNTFWDTEVFCLPFYLFNNPEAARSILQFRYDTLPQAKERAKALDCKGAFYPVATISGTECCDLWQHASLQLQASTGVMYGLWCYVSLTGDKAFLYKKGAEMLVEISRMLASRGDWSKGEYGFYGVMGPDEFQMMVHN